LLIVLILLIGFSRVYLRVHYASDVLAGFIIGFLWLLISLVVVERVENYISSEKGLDPTTLSTITEAPGNNPGPLSAIQNHISP
jgi:uncharacterized membrane protein (DUF485 family)